MKRNFYFYRGCFILRASEALISQYINKKGWVDTDTQTFYVTLEATKNAIDERLGGWSGRCKPQRHIKGGVSNAI